MSDTLHRFARGLLLHRNNGSCRPKPERICLLPAAPSNSISFVPECAGCHFVHVVCRHNMSDVWYHPSSRGDLLKEMENRGSTRSAPSTAATSHQQDCPPRRHRTIWRRCPAGRPRRYCYRRPSVVAVAPPFVARRSWTRIPPKLRRSTAPTMMALPRIGVQANQRTRERANERTNEQTSEGVNE